jgi:hypothetical protein
MTSKKSKPIEPEFDIDDTPVTSDGECTCIGRRDPSCAIKSHR